MRIAFESLQSKSGCNLTGGLLQLALTLLGVLVLRPGGPTAGFARTFAHFSSPLK